MATKTAPRVLKCKCGREVTGRRVKDTVTGEFRIVFVCECGTQIKHPVDITLEKVLS